MASMALVKQVKIKIDSSTKHVANNKAASSTYAF